MDVEELSDIELTNMKERCLYMITNFKVGKDCCNAGWGDIYKIALAEINRELDMKKLRKDGIVK